MPDIPDRRDDGREYSLLRIGCLLLGDRRELCLIRNLSAGGALVRTYSKIPVGSAAAIELKQGESVAGVVRWAEGHLAGIMFNQPVDVVQLLADSSEWPRPRQPRVEVQAIAWLSQGVDNYVAQCVDLSQGGIKVRSKSVLSFTTPVVVTLRELAPHRAYVRWNFEDTYGLVFSEPLTLRDLVGWVRKQQAASDGRRALRGEAA